MNSIMYAEATLLSATHPQIAKHTSALSVFFSSFLALGGLVAIYFSLELDRSSSTLCMILLTLGTILLLVALYRIFWRCRETVYIPTGSVIDEGSCFLDICDLQHLSDILEQGRFETSGSLTFKHSGNVRMDYMLSKDRKFAAAQLFKFIPYTYEPVSQVYYFTDGAARQFANHLSDKSF